MKAWSLQISKHTALITPTICLNASALQRITQQRLPESLKRVGLLIHDPALFSLWLLTLDGHASRVLLIPPSLTSDEQKQFCQQAQIETIITDRTDQPLPYPVLDASFLLTTEHLPEAGSRPQLTEWILCTSGTTSVPKMVRYTRTQLTATLHRVDSPYLRWGLLYDASRFAGLQVILQALLADTGLVTPMPDQPLRAIVKLFARHQVNALSATPTLWRKLIMLPETRRLPLNQITLGGEIANQLLLDQLRQMFPQAHITHIYASTEAGVGFSVKDGREGFPRQWLTHPPPGIALRIAPDGELFIRSSRKSLGYLHAPHSSQEWIATGDKVYIAGDRVRFAGRKNGAINVGGNKVMPETIEQILLQHPQVREVLVRARANPITGALVEAIVVPVHTRSSNQLLKEELVQLCQQHLPRYAIPAFIRFVDALPTTSSGKLCRAYEAAT